MGELDGTYIRVEENYDLWAVDNGHRRLLRDQEDLAITGMRPMRVVTQDEMDAIPILGQEVFVEEEEIEEGEDDDAVL